VLSITVNELYKAVSALGWQTALDSRENFYTAANLALSLIRSRFPSYATVSVEHSGRIGESFSLSALVNDFRRLPRDAVRGLSEGRDYVLAGDDKILITSYIGRRRIYIEYERAAGNINGDSGDEEIELDDKYFGLLVLLTAFYVWLDDEPEKAALYFTRYSEEAAMLAKGAHSSFYQTVINVTGW